MPKFSANLSMLFNEVDFLDRFASAAKAGFKAVEYMFPYEWSKEELAGALESNQLEQVLFNLPAGDWAGGDRGVACIPGRESEFKDGVESALAYAEAQPLMNYPGGHTEGFPDTFKQLYQEVYAAVRAGSMPGVPPFPCFRDGLHELVVCEKIKESNKKGQWVTLD